MAALTASNDLSTSISSLRVLLVEDDAEDATLFRRLLAQMPTGVARVVHCSTIAEASSSLQSGAVFDVVLLDLGLPDGNGLEELPRFLATDAAVLVLTGCDDLDLAAEAVRRGAQDYLPKQDLNALSLRRSMNHALQRQELHRQIIRAHHREQELKDEVLSHVSHELRTPLTAVAAFVDILRDGTAGETSPKQQEYLAIIERNVKQLKRLISDLMDVARINTGKLTLDIGLVDVKACIADVVDAATGQAAEKGIELSVDVRGETPRVLGDATRLAQVLQNLIDNAVKFTPQDGQVSVKTLAGKDSDLHVIVEDSGQGIAPEMLGRLFERLQQDDTLTTGSRRGLGLGLWITRELVHSMGGNIEVSSTLGKGSKFVVTLPVYTIERLAEQVIGDGSHRAVSLIHVALDSSSNRGPGCRLESGRRDATRALQRCLVASTDTIIPEPAGSGSSVHVMALVRADANGAEVVRERVAAEFAADGCRLMRFGYDATITVHTVRLDHGTDPVAEVSALVRSHLENGDRRTQIG